MNQFEDKVRAIEEFKYVNEYEESPLKGELSFQLYEGVTFASLMQLSQTLGTMLIDFTNVEGHVYSAYTSDSGYTEVKVRGVKFDKDV